MVKNILRDIYMNLFYRSLIKKTRDIHNLYPIIEITGGCIAKCPFCPTGKNFGSKKYFLEPQHFEKIIKHLKQQELICDGQVLHLYNYGEPFIHPQINEIIEIAAKNNHTVGFSSNFIKLPDFKKENYKYIDFVVFSLCGLSEETYRPIYGADIAKVLENFDLFLEKKALYNDSINVNINWIKYITDEDVIVKAKKYFGKRNCTFRSITAFLNDRDDMINLLLNPSNNEQINKIKDILDIEPCLNKIEGYKNDICFECPQISRGIVINEFGKLLGCTESSKDYDLGNVLNMDRKEIFISKLKASKREKCQQCSRLGLSKFIHDGIIE